MTKDKAFSRLFILLFPALTSALAQASTILMVPEADEEPTAAVAPQAAAKAPHRETQDLSDATGVKTPTSESYESESRWRRNPASTSPSSRSRASLDMEFTPGRKLPAAKGIQERAIIAGDTGFFPKTLSVSRNIPVRLFVTGSSKSTLCMMLDSFQVRKEVRASTIQEITFVPTEPGRYRYYCPVNSSEGTLIVRE